MAQKLTMTILPLHSLLCLVAPEVSCILKLGSCCGRILAGLDIEWSADQLWKVNQIPMPMIAARAIFMAIFLLFTGGLPCCLLYVDGKLICRYKPNNPKFLALSSIAIKEHDAGRTRHAEPPLK